MMVEYALLTKKGMKQFGHIFPDGRIPLRHILMQEAKIADYSGIIYWADYEKFTEKQKQQIQDFMIKIRKIPEKEFDRFLKENHNCIPLRSELVSAVSSSDVFKYIPDCDFEDEYFDEELYEDYEDFYE